MPGSGKTTLAELVGERLRASDVDMMSTQEIIGDELPVSRRNSIRLGLLLREGGHIFHHAGDLMKILAVPQTTQKDRLKSAYNFMTVHSLISRAHRMGKPIILDQGLAQAVWTACLRAKTDVNIPSWFSSIFPTRVRWHVVVLEADRQTLRGRLERRQSKHSRLQVSGSEDSWDRGELLYIQICDNLRRMAETGSVSMETVSTTNTTPEDIASKLMIGSIACSPNQN